MSSELFENYESEYNTLVMALNKKLTSQIPNYSGGEIGAPLAFAFALVVVCPRVVWVM